MRTARPTTVEGNNNVNAQRGDRLKVKRRAHRAANGVVVDDAIHLHLVDDFKGGFHLAVPSTNLISSGVRA